MQFDFPEYVYEMPSKRHFRKLFGEREASAVAYMVYKKIYDRTRLSESQNHRCGCCGVLTNLNSKKQRPTIEHVVPRSRGGTNNWENLVMLCYRCNNKRADRFIEEEKYVCEG